MVSLCLHFEFLVRHYENSKFRYQLLIHSAQTINATSDWLMDFYNKIFFRIFIAKDNYVETNEFLAKFVLVSFISLLHNKKESFNPIQDGFWWGCSTMGRQKAPTHLPKICPTYPTIMKIDTVTPYLKKIQKIYESRKSSLDSCWHKHFFYQKSSTFVTSRNTDIDFISMLISNSFNFF